MSNQSRYPVLETMFSGAAADGWSKKLPVSAYNTIHIVVSTSSSADGDIKVGGSFLNMDDVTFTSTATVGNEWGYVALYDYNNPSSIIVGSTGVAYNGTDSVRQFIVNVSGLNTMSIELDNYVAGNFTVKVFAVTNQ